MGKKKPRGLSWKDEPDKDDYPAAANYLSLLLSDAASIVEELRRAETQQRTAKDLLRACGLPLLPADDPHVANDLRKAAAGDPLSPVLLVRGDAQAGRPLTIADGYHRICAAYHLDESADVPCRLVDLPAGR